MDVPEILEFESQSGPGIAAGQGCHVVDVRIRVGGVQSAHDFSAAAHDFGRSVSVGSDGRGHHARDGRQYVTSRSSFCDLGTSVVWPGDWLCSRGCFALERFRRRRPLSEVLPGTSLSI
jgi:hypothetical protein